MWDSRSGWHSRHAWRDPVMAGARLPWHWDVGAVGVRRRAVDGARVRGAVAGAAVGLGPVVRPRGRGRSRRRRGRGSRALEWQTRHEGTAAWRSCGNGMLRVTVPAGDLQPEAPRQPAERLGALGGVVARGALVAPRPGVVALLAVRRAADAQLAVPHAAGVAAGARLAAVVAVREARQRRPGRVGPRRGGPGPARRVLGQQRGQVHAPRRRQRRQDLRRAADGVAPPAVPAPRRDGGLALDVLVAPRAVGPFDQPAVRLVAGGAPLGVRHAAVERDPLRVGVAPGPGARHVPGARSACAGRGTSRRCRGAGRARCRGCGCAAASRGS